MPSTTGTPPSETEWISYTCEGGSFAEPCNETNVTQDHWEEKAFFFCDRCAGPQWQRRDDAVPVQPLPVNAYMCISLPQVRFDRKVYVALGEAALAHLLHINTSDVVVTFAELLSIKEGLLEVAEGPTRTLRLAEGLNYFARARGRPTLSFY